MLCTNLYAYQKVDKKGTRTKRVSIRPDWLEAHHPDILTGRYVDEFKPCTGSLSVSLQISQGCCCSDNSELEVVWKCTECGVLNFTPKTCGDRWDFTEFVNALLAKTDSMPYTDTLTLEYEKRAKRNKLINHFISMGMTSQAALEEVVRAELEATNCLNLRGHKP